MRFVYLSTSNQDDLSCLSVRCVQRKAEVMESRILQSVHDIFFSFKTEILARLINCIIF